MTETSPDRLPDNAARDGRTIAEWVTFWLSCLVLVAVAVLILLRLVGSPEPAAPVAELGQVRTVVEQRQVVVVVRNAGDDTAANATVRLEFEVNGEPDDAEQTIDFLSGGEVVKLVFVIPDDASQDGLSARVTGFTDP